MPTKHQLTIIHTLLNKHKMIAHKAEIIAGFTGGRTESSRDLQPGEAVRLIKYLNSLASASSATDVKAERMRRKIISLGHEMNWRILTGSMAGKIDMKRIDAWCTHFGYLHKRLDDYTYQELPRLITQFENGPYKHYLSNLK